MFPDISKLVKVTNDLAKEIQVMSNNIKRVCELLEEQNKLLKTLLPEGKDETQPALP